jgi:tetratricopeptide (TPR) repeat protein
MTAFRFTEPVTRSLGLAATILYAAVIAWLLASQPRSMAEAVGGLSATVGTYDIDAQSFADGIAFFRRDQFVEARAAFARADPASRDARTQFYIAYAYYRQGWHRTYRDDALYREGLKHVDLAIALAPLGRLIVDDESLRMQSADELRAELEAGLTREASDLNPLRLLQERK